jgi:hypothetical protein
MIIENVMTKNTSAGFACLSTHDDVIWFIYLLLIGHFEVKMFPLPALNSYSGVSYPAVADFETISTIIYQDWGWRGGYFSFLYRPWLNRKSMNEGRALNSNIFGHLLIAFKLPYFCGN